ncbi:MAG: 30S ribosomal protein S20 [SAR202 cluster bacterium Io17-Chloro-G9]|nr:MAG: 30S ribosomal protein S20 [SAR202 cluster bacterium Io17-Chloro-G9]
MPPKKAARQSVKQYQRNRSVRSNTRSTMVRVLRTLGSGDVEAAEPAFQEAVSALDKAAQMGAVNKKTASRYKSRLAARLNQLKAAESA